MLEAGLKQKATCVANNHEALLYRNKKQKAMGFLHLDLRTNEQRTFTCMNTFCDSWKKNREI